MRGLCIVMGANLLAKDGTINEVVSMVIACKMDRGSKGDTSDVTNMNVVVA